jgi:transmembrane sensor
MVAAAATPFVVLAGDALITAHAREFDVDRVTAERTDVVLMQGAVDIARRPRFGLIRPVRLIRLTGRQRFSLRGPGVQLVQAAPLSSPPDWTAGPLSFDGAPLNDAIVEANRYSVRKIRLGSPDLGRLKITGVFDTDAPQSLAQGVARALGLSLETAPNGDLVLSRQGA